eukprot:CAMPEP_0198583252 /NCGR_PEP_ID=MMETSP1462-20131121/126524_1 /TAXON_ID=1333877 /ORGANISM="Brandtodinium nutriculum, Strain RCC3387" /LENGTH=697 /DNA_ID=CAMNT_0044314663 /DNA_START=70 /DNA_END=2160 /DNA_ORIENTATION=-
MVVWDPTLDEAGERDQGDEAGARERVDSAGGATGAGCIKVCLRARPFNAFEKEQKQHENPCLEITSKTNLVITNPENQEDREMSFDRVYNYLDTANEPAATQEFLMNDLGKEIKDSVMDGYHGSLIAYGPTGSGKTHTMFGTSGAAEQEGLLPRMVQAIFSDVEKMKQNKVDQCRIRITMQYLEIYNEQIRDLMSPDGLLAPPSPDDDVRPRKLVIRESPNVGVFVAGLTDVQVTSWDETNEALQSGIQKRAVGSTLMNDTSSRSHCICMFEIMRQMLGEALEVRSKAFFVDLAGSERTKQAQTSGARQQEGNHINKSLSALAQCVSALVNIGRKSTVGGAPVKQHVPFRNAKLTHLLQEALCGNSRTCILVAVNAGANSYWDTLSTLQFAQRAKRIQTKAVKNVENRGDLMKALQAELERLRAEVSSGHAQKDEVADLEKIKTKYGSNLEFQLQRAASFQQKKAKILDGRGVSPMALNDTVGLAKSCPHLLNICYDTHLAGCLVYFLSPDVESTVGTAPSCKIRLAGLGMEAEMARFSTEDGIVFMTHVEGRVLINGSQVQEGKKQLEHNDRLFFGFSHCFRFVIPDRMETGDHQESQAFKMRMSISAVREVVPEHNSVAYEQCTFLMRQLQGVLGEVKVRALQYRFKQVCVLVEEANAITHEMRPHSRLEFTPEVATDFSNQGSPEAIVRLRSYP